MLERDLPIAKFSLRNLQALLEKIVTVNRKVAVGLKNYTDHKLELHNTYHWRGLDAQYPPGSISRQEAGLWSARQQDHSSERFGGVISYYIEDVDQTVLVMWSIPFEYAQRGSSNWWNVAVKSGPVDSNYTTYENMLNGTGGYDSPHKPDHWKVRHGGRFNLEGIMTTDGQALLEVELRYGFPKPGKDVPKPGKDVPELGKDVPKPGKDGPETGKDGPEQGKDGPEQGKDGPEQGIDGPEQGKVGPKLGEPS